MIEDAPRLSHEKLDVYQKSIQFLVLSTRISADIPKGNAELVDQLKRAALSVPLNIAEACGRTGSRDNSKHFTIARGSALECGAIVDICLALGYLEKERFIEAKRLLVSVVAMLTKLCFKG